MKNIKYPDVYRDEDITDNFFGLPVKDPYCWLEDPESERTKKFVANQNELSQKIVRQNHLHFNISEKYKLFDNFPKEEIPIEITAVSSNSGVSLSFPKRYLSFYNEGLQNQPVLYLKDSYDASIKESKMVLNPNVWCSEGMSSINSIAASYDAKILAYLKSDKGSDWSVMKFINLTTLKHLEDELHHICYSCLQWSHDSRGIFYNKYDELDTSKSDIEKGIDNKITLNQKLYYHILNKNQKEDILIWDYPEDSECLASLEFSNDFNFLLLYINKGCNHNNLLWYLDLRKWKKSDSDFLKEDYMKMKDSWVKLVNDFKGSFLYVNNEDELFTFLTNYEAANSKLLQINFKEPDISNWHVLIKEMEDINILSARCLNKKYLVLHCIKDVSSILQIRNAFDGAIIKIISLEICSLTSISGGYKYSDMFFQIESLTSYRKIYKVDLNDKNLDLVLVKEAVIPCYDSSALVSKQVFYRSTDGVRVPMFIVHKKDIKLDGSNPTILYGYGGFRISIFANFSLLRVMWCIHFNGIYAIANVRGGGEYGESWYTSAIKANKQVSYNDFQAAAEYLIQKNYTSNKKLAISGGSNGGLMVGVCFLQRPDLYAAVVAHVGVFDLLKFHKFTIGYAWKSDYGDVTIEEDFKSMIKRSPLHMVKNYKEKNVNYPSLLLLTADHDDRVPPFHSYKFIAELQFELGRNENPFLLLVDTNTGHGGGKPKWKIVRQIADELTFEALCLDAKWVD